LPYDQQKFNRLLFQNLHIDDRRVADFVAHYTSYESALNILKSREIWFSNPMLSNDYQELLPRLDSALRLVGQNPKLSNVLTNMTGVHEKFLNALEFCRQHFLKDEIANTYIFCLSEFKEPRGLLSMWRGYGGDGTGIALVFKTRAMDQPGSPITITPVLYMDEKQHQDLISGFGDTIAEYFKTHALDEMHVLVAAWWIFRALVIHALSWKHCGFAEEREIRLIYTPITQGESNGTMNLFERFSLTAGGPVSRLCLPIKPIPAILSDDVTLENLLTQIVLGPVASSLLAVATFRRLLVAEKLGQFADRVVACDIPYRKVR
jgi:hypothetical protein